VTLTGSTCYATDNMAPAVGGSCVADDFSGADVFYKLTAGAGDTLDVSVTGSWYPVAYLVSSCDSVATTCVASTPSLETADHVTGSFVYVFASGASYNLVVDGLNGECGDFTLTTRLHGPTTDVPLGGVRAAGLTLSVRPNPSRGTVFFSGWIPLSAGPAQVTIHDAAGRTVASLGVTSSSGRFEIGWDGRDQSGSRVAAGVYFARVVAGGQTANTALILMR